MNPAPPVTIARIAAYRRRLVFVTFEGLDGTGKSTQAELLAEALRREGREVVLTREPGGTPLGEQVREVLLGDGEITAWAEAALFAAARAELVERVIAPAIAAGSDVVCDRYLDSSLAYQGIARGLGIERVLELNLQATRGLLPDRTFLLLLDPAEAARRQGAPGDRLERAGDEFRSLVDRAYRDLAELFPRRIVAVDATQSAEQIATVVRGRLGDPAAP
jgi:dTMP kinase